MTIHQDEVPIWIDPEGVMRMKDTRVIFPASVIDEFKRGDSRMDCPGVIPR